MRIPYFAWGYLAILLGFALYLVLVPEVFYVYALGLVLIALVSFTFGTVFEAKEERRKTDLGSAKYFTKLVESNKEVTAEDLELIFGKVSDIFMPLWILLIGFAAIEVPKEISGIQPFGTTFTYVLVIGGLATVAFAMAMLIVKSLNPFKVQTQYFEDYLAAKKKIRERENKVQS